MSILGDAELEEAWGHTRANAYAIQTSSGGICLTCSKRVAREQIVSWVIWVDGSEHTQPIASENSTARCPYCNAETVFPFFKDHGGYDQPFLVALHDYVREKRYVTD